MTTISILPENPDSPASGYIAVAGAMQSVGKTAGEALDAITSRLAEQQRGTLVVVQHLRPDSFFSESQRQRLSDLMSQWRTARDQGRAVDSADQAELDALVAAELKATACRAAMFGQ